MYTRNGFRAFIWFGFQSIYVNKTNGVSPNADENLNLTHCCLCDEEQGKCRKQLLVWDVAISWPETSRDSSDTDQRTQVRVGVVSVSGDMRWDHQDISYEDTLSLIENIKTYSIIYEVVKYVQSECKQFLISDINTEKS